MRRHAETILYGPHFTRFDISAVKKFRLAETKPTWNSARSS